MQNLRQPQHQNLQQLLLRVRKFILFIHLFYCIVLPFILILLIKSILVPSECENYHSFDQDDRNEYSSEEGWFCDSSDKHTSEDWHGEGWYRFTGKAGKLKSKIGIEYFSIYVYLK